MQAHSIVTSTSFHQTHTFHKDLKPRPDSGVERNVVNLYPEITYQTFEGFGGALTEASAYTWSKMPAELQEEFLECYFGKSGIGYRLARMAIDSCDFTLGTYAALSARPDPKWENFSLERDETYILPFLRAAEKKLGKKLEVMLSPWSPPAFMKTTGRRILGGKLKPECRADWAEYLAHYIEEYRKRKVNVTRLSVQNEPNAIQLWDSCQFTSKEEKTFLKDFLCPALRAHGLSDLELYIWDHNKERAFERAREILDYETRPLIAGVAFHWYSGDHFDALRLVREQYPEMKLAFSEGCVEHLPFVPRTPLGSAQRYAHDMIGNLNAGMNLSFDWNILLDERGGPNHMRNFCDAPIHYLESTKELRKTLSYTYIGHFSRYIKPFAKRIALTVGSRHMEATAVRNPNGTITAVLLNRDSHTLPANLRISGQLLRTKLPGNSISTILIRE